MALTKVKGSGVEGITNLSNATFLSVNASEVVTLLTSAVINSEGGAVTSNIAQSLTKQWLRFNQDTPAINDSFNVASVTDSSAGAYGVVPTNNWSATSNITASCSAQAEATNANCTQYMSVGTLTTSNLPRNDVENNTGRDAATSCTIVCGELA